MRGTATDVSKTQEMAERSLAEARWRVFTPLDGEGAKNRSQDWPKFDGQILGYIVWKDWFRHHEEVYLGVEQLKRILIKKCLLENIKRTMEEV